MYAFPPSYPTVYNHYQLGGAGRLVIVRNGFAISGWIANPDFTRIGPLAGLALLVVGVIAQVAYWDTLPVWYHLVFLASLIPMAMAGANLITRRCNADQVT